MTEHPTRAPAEALMEAASNVVSRMFSTYKARNGREVGVQGDDGEMCWIVHSDEINDLQIALATYRQSLDATPELSSDGAVGLVEADDGPSKLEMLASLLRGYSRDRAREKFPETARVLAESAQHLLAYDAALAAHRAKPSVGVAIPDHRQLLALRAIKAVTATTKNAADGLSRIMSIARQAGVPEPYSELMADPDIALIVTADDRRKWQHLFAAPSPAAPAPDGEDEA